MQETTFRCDLCGSVIERNRVFDSAIRIKKKPAGGWQCIEVQSWLDLCETCEEAIVDKINELEQANKTGGTGMNENDIRIGHTGDAINLIDELLENLDTGSVVSQEMVRVGLEALKDALERGII